MTVEELQRAGAGATSPARASEGLEGLRASWEAIPWARLDPVPDYFLTVVRSRPEVVRPHVVRLAEDDGDPVWFVARLEDVRLTTSVGYRSVHRPRVRCLTLVHGGFHGADTAARANAVVAEVRRVLASGEADVAVLPSLRPGSPLHDAASRVPSRVRELGARGTHWALRLPDTFDDFVRSRSKKTRENIRVYRNRLHRDHGDVTLRVFRAAEEADELFADLDAVSGKTYQRGLGVAFAATPEQRALAQLELERGWFRAYVLYAHGEPIAFWAGTAWNRTFFVGTPGYDPAYADYSIGTYVLMRVVEDLCADDGIDVLDYGFGDAEYKRRFGSESWEERDVLLFAPTLRGLRLRLTRRAVTGAVRLAKAGLERAGIERRVKQRWRRRLSRS